MSQLQQRIPASEQLADLAAEELQAVIQGILPAEDQLEHLHRLHLLLVQLPHEVKVESLHVPAQLCIKTNGLLLSGLHIWGIATVSICTYSDPWGLHRAARTVETKLVTRNKSPLSTSLWQLAEAGRQTWLTGAPHKPALRGLRRFAAGLPW